jgi:outer membrane murein-binding lipoprotein Lpp
MSGQPQNQFFPRSAVVKELETRLEDSSKIYDLAPVYQQLCHDPVVVLAVRYLALGAISNKLNLYSSQHSQIVSITDAASTLANEISDQIHATDSTRFLASVQHLKAHYPSIYRLNTLLFDRAAANAVECVDLTPIQDSSGEAVPAIQPSSVFAVKPSIAEKYTIPNQDFARSQATVSKYAPSPKNNTIVIGACLLASALLAGTFFTLDRSNTSQDSTALGSPRSSPSASASSASLPITSTTSVSSSSLPIPTVSVPIYSPSISPSLYSPTPVSTPAVSARSVAPIPITANQSVPRNKAASRPNSSDGRNLVDPTPSTANNSSQNSLQRPSANTFIRQYYEKLKSGQHQSAWLDLAPSFQHNRQANPGGYSGEYSQWWGGLGKRTQVGKIETMKRTDDQAIVRVHCQYRGEPYIAEYYLAFDNPSQSWKISQIKKLS